MLKHLNCLIDHGADLNFNCSSGWTPVMMAIRKCNIKILTLLIERGADINFIDSLGWTPITKAVHENKMEIIKCLIAQGADLNLKPSNIPSALLSAVLNKI